MLLFRLSICTTNHRFPLLLPRSNNENPLTIARAERARDHIVIHMMDPHSTFFVFILHTRCLFAFPCTVQNGEISPDHKE